MTNTDQIVRESLARLLKDMHKEKEKRPTIDNINKYQKAADYFKDKYGFEWSHIAETGVQR